MEAKLQELPNQYLWLRKLYALIIVAHCHYIDLSQLASAFMEPGDLNAGLQDQVLALQFLKQNIAQFGGDASKVTIWGQVSRLHIS